MSFSLMSSACVLLPIHPSHTRHSLFEAGVRDTAAPGPLAALGAPEEDREIDASIVHI